MVNDSKMLLHIAETSQVKQLKKFVHINNIFIFVYTSIVSTNEFGFME